MEAAGIERAQDSLHPEGALTSQRRLTSLGNAVVQAQMNAVQLAFAC